MIIQSDAISMNSRRSFDSTRAGYTKSTQQSSNANSFTLTNRVGIFSYSYTESHNGHLAGTKNQKDSENNAGNSQEEQIADNGKRDSLTDLMNRMQSSSSIRRTSLNNPVDTFHRMKTQTINYLLSILFGRKFAEPDIRYGSQQNDNDFYSFMQTTAGELQQATSGQLSQNSREESFFYYSENETTCFDTTGMVRTADGREIPFNISLEMSRSFTQAASKQIDFKQPVVCDPLVINLNHNVADVSDQKFYFDLDADGEKESISRLKSGSGYLALDKNEDGIINDGSELFGTTNGNGFADLAQYDKDGNGWIDEADEIFSKLRIWTQDENGNDQLMTLADAGVGAIYLGYEDTEFSLNSLTDNSTNALIRKTGLFLYENGMSGTVQQMDLAT